MRQKEVPRSCGACQACCQVFTVPEVGKHDFLLCRHAKNSRCTIYPMRPLACRKFRCAWLNGTGDDRYRPDKLGVMMGIYDCDLGNRVVGVLHLWRLRAGAFEEPLVHDLAEANLEAGLAVIYHEPDDSGNFVRSLTARRQHFTYAEVQYIQHFG